MDKLTTFQKQFGNHVNIVIYNKYYDTSILVQDILSCIPCRVGYIVSTYNNNYEKFIPKRCIHKDLKKQDIEDFLQLKNDKFLIFDNVCNVFQKVKPYLHENVNIILLHNYNEIPQDIPIHYIFVYGQHDVRRLYNTLCDYVPPYSVFDYYYQQKKDALVIHKKEIQQYIMENTNLIFISTTMKKWIQKFESTIEREFEKIEYKVEEKEKEQVEEYIEQEAEYWITYYLKKIFSNFIWTT